MENDNAAPTPATTAQKRVRSEIEFPYSDLGAAIELAQMIHDKAGSSCEPDELAAWMGQTASGGTFRTRVGAARMFGLIDTANGRLTLTQLGRDILPSSGSDRAAKVTAFLNVELFSAIYDLYKGNVLPPPPAIERQIEQFGVSPKQKERARQTFAKSATVAGFIDQTTGRFVKPGIAPREEQSPPPKPPGGGGSGGNGSDDGVTGDPLVDALLKKLPKAGGSWPEAERQTWMKMMAMAFDLAYGVSAPSA